MSSSANSVMSLRTISPGLRLREAGRPTDQIGSMKRNPLARFGLALSGAQLASLALAHLVGTAVDWQSLALRAFGLTLCMAVFQLALGMGAIWSVMGGLCFAWHPLTSAGTVSDQWAGLIILMLILIGALPGRFRRSNLFVAMAAGAIFGILTPTAWIGLFFVGWAIAHIVSWHIPSSKSHRLISIFGVLGGFAGVSALGYLVPSCRIANSYLSNFSPIAKTTLGPLSWFDRAGLLVAQLPMLPNDLVSISSFGYLGIVPMLLGLVAVCPSRELPQLGSRRKSLLVVVGGILMLWLQCGVSSFQGHMTRLFAVITVEKEVGVPGQHLVGLLAALVVAMPVILFFALREVIGSKPGTPWPWVVAAGAALMWWSLSPGDFGLSPLLDSPAPLAYVRGGIAIAWSVLVAIGLQRMTRALAWKPAKVVVICLLFGFAMIDLAWAVIPTSASF